MSLIFKALKKLKEQPVADHQDPSPQKERYVYSFRKLILSPVLLIAVLGLVVVVGFGIYYATIYDGKPPVTPAVTKAPPPRSVPVPGDTQPDNAGTYMAKAAPDDLGSDSPTPMPAADRVNSAEKGNMPESLTPSRSMEILGSDQSTPNNQESKTRFSQNQSDFLPRTSAPDGVVAQASKKPLPLPSKKSAPGPERSAPLHVEAGAAGKDRKIQQSRPAPEAKTPPATATLKPPGTTSITKAPSQKTAASNRKRSRAKVLRSKKEEQARITRLVTRIEKQMNLYEDQETWRLIDELEALKGPENIYVLKLKAYWHLRHDEFDAAVALLNKVLQKNAEDLEAGINMAVAEMKTNQLAAAEERLAKLREVYPENSLIPEMLHKLR